LSEKEENIIDASDVIAAVIEQDTQHLTTPEFAALCRAIRLNMNVKRVAGYEKVKGLFTEADGTKMEQATWEAFMVLFLERTAPMFSEEKRDKR
jgi:hypothetical protein